jgi:NADPH:quinone reductase-like Zn-dependent oxidoreductase
MAGYFNYTFPFILGTDVSGVIEAVGEDVADYSVGDAVYTRAGVYRDGSYGQYVLASASDLAAKPNSLDHIQAAALPHVTLTAWQALIEHANLQEGQTILIHGAAGGVGHVAVQLAKNMGANVIGTASLNYGILEELGVDQAINYSVTPFEDVARNVDVVLDTIGGDTQERSWATLKQGGILVSTFQEPNQDIAARYGVRQAMVMTNPPIAQTLTEVAHLVDAGKIKPVVSAVLPLQEMQKAHQMIEGKHTCGKIVIQEDEG